MGVCHAMIYSIPAPTLSPASSPAAFSLYYVLSFPRPLPHLISPLPSSLYSPGNIKLVAFDFDRTIISKHTGGIWRDSAEELAKFVRPSFKCYIATCLDQGLDVAITTFSTQESLIRLVLSVALGPQSAKIAFFGGDLQYTGYIHGKQSQLKAALSWANQKHAESQLIIGTSDTVLIDDDPNNIKVALQDNYRVMHYDRRDRADNNLYSSKLV
jgi:hydroxymethylpyrimidine pyrophosphatase-like HAD family hydrolase